MYQRLVLVGNLGRDPEMRYTPQGTPVTSLSVATSRRYNTTDGQTKEETLWFRVSVWGKQAEACNQYLTKGQKVLVEGSLVGDENGGPRVWMDKEGKPRASFDVHAYTVHFLGRREGVPATAPASGTTPNGVVVEEPASSENLPF
jgi:single-strand DNA-binding protein